MTTITDIFAGAGGSSTGAAAVAGVEVKIAANHWRLAVDVHQLNHQDTEHACVDLHMEDPRNFPRTDVLWASPECTKWSVANSKARALSEAMGGDVTLFDDVPDELQTSEQDEIDRSRLLMFDVLRFIEHHRYRAVIVENVVDIATQAKYARAWESWRRGLDRLGYAFRVVSLNAMHSQMLGDPAPQSRDRLYIVAWPKREKAPDIERALRPPAWCLRCERIVEARQAWKPGRSVGRYRAQYVYACPACGLTVEPGWLPAASAIDWTLPAERIGDRKRPLSPKTMARIREGLRRYGTHVIDRRGEYRVRSLDAALSTITANETTKAIILEAAGNTYDLASGSGNRYLRAWPADEPLRTLHTSMSKALLVPVEGRDGKRAAGVDEVMRTQTCRNETGLLITLRGENAPKVIDDPLDTIAASGNHHGLLIRNNTHRPGDSGYLSTSTDEVMRTLTASNVHSLLQYDGQAVTEDDVMACWFRMLEPHEIANGMAFPRTYIWQGTKRDRVRLAGNAVCPPSARDLVAVTTEGFDAA